jgi:hypothetical protein
MPEQAREEWSERMFALAIDCAGSCADDGRKRLRAFWQLLAMAPQPALVQGITRVSPGRMQALLSAEAFDCAALEIFGRDGKATISLESGRCTATVILPGDAVQGFCAGSSLAFAVLGAVAVALSQRAKTPMLRIIGPQIEPPQVPLVNRIL